jgi:adenylate cyclase
MRTEMTAFLLAAKSRGCQVQVGSDMLFEQIPAYRLFDGPVQNLEGRFILLGVNALALGDQHATINEDAMPGALMHLQALDQMLSGRFITAHPGFDRVIFLVCALIACLVCYLVVHVPLVYALAIVCLSFTILMGVSAYSFIQFGFVFNFFTSLAILLVGGVCTYILQSFHEERLRKKMQTSFAQYVPPDVVKRISKSSQAPKLGGELIEAAVLFLDLRGFTNLTETLKPYPELMVQVIGTIMDEVTARLIESGATIDKYIGDAVMAFWNAPEKQDDYLVRSIYGACRIQEDLELIRSKIHEIDPIVKEIQIAFGIGICCGPITVGNFGSSFRFNYTALGDAVNTASRLESLTKEKGQPILVAADSLSDHQQFEFNGRKIQVNLIGTTEIRGKVEVLKIFSAKFI